MEGSLERTLKAKVIACLDLMEEHLPGPPSTKKPKKSIETETSSIDVPTEIPCNPADETKRKRGRPPKKSLVAKSSGDAASQNTLLDDEEDMVPYNPPARKKARKNSNVASRLVQNADLKDSEEEDDENDMVPYNPPVRGKGRKSMNGADNGKVKAAPSLSNLITKFEEQYHVMGEIYQQVGQTLHALKSKIQENRTTTEEEIRNELLQEVQDNLLKSFGKK